MKRIKTFRFPEFKLHQLDGHIQSMYLVEYEDRLLLLDGGCKCDSGGVRDVISLDLQRSLDDLKLCVVSHMHPDHAGGARSLRRYTGSPLAAHPDCDLWYSGAGGFIQHKVDTYLAWWVSRKQNRQKRRIRYPRTLHADFALTDGEPLPGFEDWQFFSTPGHTSHDGCLYHQSTGLLYAADLIVRIKGKYLPPFPVTLREAMVHSLRRIEKLPVKTLLLAHGGAVNLEHDPLDVPALCRHIRQSDRLGFKLLSLGTHFGRELRKAKRRKWDYH